MKEEIPARPFADWITVRLAELERDETVEQPVSVLAGRLFPDAPTDSAVRFLHRYRNCVRAGSRDGVKGDYPTDTFLRGPVEDALREYGEALQNVPGYQDLPEPELEADAFCERCHVIVTPISGVCPWCETKVVDGFDRERRYCERENRMVFPANDGSCWRCGGTTKRGAPHGPCACGCGETIRLFDRHGRAVRFVHGHAPRSLENAGDVDLEPFAVYLEQRLERMDLLQALAREHGISRDTVVNVLARRDTKICREVVRRALWVSGRGGTGKGLPMRPDAVGFFDLYPDDRRSRTCPDCGHGKAPHAELCKRCRVTANRRDGRRPPRSTTRLSDEIITEAYALYSENGMSLLEAAESVFERTPHKNVGSTANALSRSWKQRGWAMRERTTPAKAAA